ncbi:hypothetical protein OQA88_3052 [Cercophora sp. LCS_1]
MGCCDCAPIELHVGREEDRDRATVPAVDAMHSAICGGSYLVFQLLFESNPVMADEEGLAAYQLLRSAAWYGRLEVCRFLVEEAKYSTSVMNGHLGDTEMRPALLYSADQGHLAVVGKYLISKGADFTAIHDGKSILARALTKRNLSDALLLLKRLPEVSRVYSDPISTLNTLGLDKTFGTLENEKLYTLATGIIPDPQVDDIEDELLQMVDPLHSADDRDLVRGYLALIWIACCRCFLRVIDTAVRKVGKQAVDGSLFAKFVEQAGRSARSQKGLGAIKTLLSFACPEDTIALTPFCSLSASLEDTTRV